MDDFLVHDLIEFSGSLDRNRCIRFGGLYWLNNLLNNRSRFGVRFADGRLDEFSSVRFQQRCGVGHVGHCWSCEFVERDGSRRSSEVGSGGNRWRQKIWLSDSDRCGGCALCRAQRRDLHF